MQSEVASGIPPSPEMEARAKLKSRFELFSQPLPAEAELFAMWDDSDEVIASIACATFEHGDLLDDAIRSFLMQKTDFRFEIVIRDDASTDGTCDLIADYMQRYPGIVRARVYDENQFKLGRRPADDWAELTRGQYIAICEGDDFWIDRDKLHDQVAQLERHPDAVISVAGTLFYHVSEDTLQEKGRVDNEALYTDFPSKYHHTSTFLVERQVLKKVIAKMKYYQVYGDVQLRRLIVDYGKCICLPRTVSVYWVNGKGIWTSLDDERRVKEIFLNHFGMMKALRLGGKVSLFPNFVRACSRYFPQTVRYRRWGFVVLCLFPYIAVKGLNLIRHFFYKTT